jgi:membrane-associated phospholipid phosphatase
MINYRIKFIILVILSLCLVQQVYSQSKASDSSYHPYHVNYWVSVPIIGIGMVTNYLGIPQTLHKAEITDAEIKSLNKDVINSIDTWSLRQDPTQMTTFEHYSDYTIAVTVVLPAFLMFDKQIRKDWLTVLFMYMETMSITPNIYEWSFLGPTFIERFRPMTYYDKLTDVQRKAGNNRNSLYSGHVASVAASTFFMVKVYSDFNPSIGDNKYLLYAAATVPPLILGYFRIRALKHFPSDVMVGLGVGALCGIIIPELHRIQAKNISLGMFSSPESTGITMKWELNLLK